MAASTIAPTAIAMPPSDMMLELIPMACIGMKEISTATGIVTMGISALGMCHRKIEDHEADHDQLFDQRVLQIVDGGQDQLAAVVGGDDLHAGRQAGLHLLQLGLHALDDAQRILALPHDDDAGDHLAPAIQIGDAAADIGAERHAADVAHQDGHAGRAGGERERFQVGRRSARSRGRAPCTRGR